MIYVCANLDLHITMMLHNKYGSMSTAGYCGISSGRRHCDRMVVGFTTIYNEHASADSHVIFSW